MHEKSEAENQFRTILKNIVPKENNISNFFVQ